MKKKLAKVVGQFRFRSALRELLEYLRMTIRYDKGIDGFLSPSSAHVCRTSAADHPHPTPTS